MKASRSAASPPWPASSSTRSGSIQASGTHQDDREFYTIPLLIVPPWINKFYILDLKPENSFIKWATEQGYTVFVISWVNPDEHLTKLMFDDYMKLRAPRRPRRHREGNRPAPGLG